MRNGSGIDGPNGDSEGSSGRGLRLVTEDRLGATHTGRGKPDTKDLDTHPLSGEVSQRSAIDQLFLLQRKGYVF